MLLYHSPGSSLTTFYNTLEDFTGHHTIDLVLGDFNIDNLNRTNISLQNVLCNYTLLVNEATHISVFLLDHVFC